jgi:hypothetical protein
LMMWHEPHPYIGSDRMHGGANSLNLYWARLLGIIQTFLGCPTLKHSTIRFENPTQWGVFSTSKHPQLSLTAAK